MGAWISGHDCCNLVGRQRQNENAHISKHPVELHYNGIQSHSTINVNSISIQPKTIPAAYCSYIFYWLCLCFCAVNLTQGAKIMFLDKRRFYKFPIREMSDTAGWKLVLPSFLNHILSPLLTIIALSKYPLCLSFRDLFYFLPYHFTGIFTLGYKNNLNTTM